MGGTTSVTLRKPDGEEFRMTRWTNSMPWGICNPRMFNANEAHMNLYLEQWLDMKRDYEKNHIGGNFEHNMTSCYFPSAGLAPCGYGLTVVDHVNNVILDMQGYCSFGDVNVAGVGLDIRKSDDGEQLLCNMDDDSTFRTFKEFYDEGRILGVTTAKSYDEKRPYDPLPDVSFEEIVKLIATNYDRKGDHWYQFIVDTAPFTIERFEECDHEETERMRQRVLELGFVLTDEENKEWDEFIKEQREEYEWEEGDE
jgi:hypothetical protein